MQPARPLRFALALLAGGRIFAAMKRSLGIGEWIRGVWAPRFSLQSPRSQWVSTPAFSPACPSQTRLRSNKVAHKFHSEADTQPQPSVIMSGGPAMMTPNPALMMRPTTAQAKKLPIEGVMPSLSGAVAWLNSPPLTAEALKGKVVLVDSGPILHQLSRAIPYVRAWAENTKTRVSW